MDKQKQIEDMEEKKLTDDTEINVGMIENALKCLAGQKACDLCAYDDLAMQDGERTCINLVAEDTLDLIHRLQGEIQRLAKVEMEFIGKIADQKAEIERLTKELDKEYDLRIMHQFACEKKDLELKQLEFENAELQIQVDELTERYLEESKERCEYEQKYKKIQHTHNIGLGTQRSQWEKKVKQAVKDTAKEILQKLYSIRDKDQVIRIEMHNLQELCDGYGVEVE